MSVVGFLPDHMRLSGFRVTPVVAIVRPGFELLLDARRWRTPSRCRLTSCSSRRNHRPRVHRFRRGRCGGQDVRHPLWEPQHLGCDRGHAGDAVPTVHRGPGVSGSGAPGEAMSALLELMARLRDPQSGCPWDREQTFAPSRPTPSRKPTKWPMPSSAASRPSCATSWVICCSRWCSMRAWPRSRAGSISRSRGRHPREARAPPSARVRRPGARRRCR